ncbi:hypothetical protein C8R44DRAFT_783260 [Mycena epipterygia]|nr:hypothetical protein C8R44DRAFT_783260 [Mycena epipterygia]
MLSSLSTSNRRRGLRGDARKASREHPPAAAPLSPANSPSLYCLSSSGHASSSSLASDHTVRRVSRATFTTSLSRAASSSHCSPERTAPSHSTHGICPAPESTTYPRTPNFSPIEFFRIRRTERNHLRKQSVSRSEEDAPVRVVGGGRVFTSVPPVAMIEEATRPARLSGRGGAGTRPWKIKPPGEKNHNVNKDFKFPWNGKGKARADPNALEITANMNPLTRTDTGGSVGSGIMFAPISTHSHQRVVQPESNPFDFTGSQNSTTASVHSVGSTTSSHGRQVEVPQASRMNKLTRTLGAEFASPGTSRTRAHKDRSLSSRSSMSLPSLRIPGRATPTENYTHRQSSFGPSPFSSISSINHPPRNGSALSMSTPTSDYSSAEVSPTSSSTTPSTPSTPTPPLSPFKHTPPSRPLRPDDVPVDMRMDSARLQASGEVHGQPRFSLSDTDDDKYECNCYRAQTPCAYDPDEYDRENAQTPVPRLDDSDGKRLDHPDGKRVSSSFQVMPLFVVPPREPTDTDLSVGELPTSQHEWTGEWNRNDMQSVIQGLRHLRVVS